VEAHENDVAKPVASESMDSSMPTEGMTQHPDNDIQHGRRTQMKKKPRFNVEETEMSPAEEAKV
jgi:hypothetical protein